MTDDIQKLLDKYWAGESSLEDEQALKDHFSGNDNHDELTPLFSYLNSEKDNTYNFEPDLSFTKDKAKVRYLLPKIIGIAASLVLLFTLSTGTFNSTDQSYKNKYTEVEDPEEALEIAMDALGFLSKKYEKGASPMTKHINKLEKTAVFKFN